MDRGEWIPMVYCVIGIVVGNLTLLSLFTGILLNNFTDETSSKATDADKIRSQADFQDFWQEDQNNGNTNDWKKICSRHCFFSALRRIYKSFGLSADSFNFATPRASATSESKEVTPEEEQPAGEEE